MAITQLDKTTALIVIDLQCGIVALPPQHTVPGVIEQANRLIDVFHQQQRPVVLVNVAGGAPGRTDQKLGSHSVPDNWTTLVDELHRQDDDILITKRTWGAFMHTDLHQQLQALGVTQVVIVGIATSIGVESTARQAFELGYHVTLCTDAMTDLNLDNHQHAINAIFPRLAETGTTQDVLALL
ncbi:isochorismatase family protein [Vibrio fluvialis]|uniref:isochorismatase family protein n=1 Tax=Vibrio fluvialis TaxID=676 RepID=UPI001C9C3095|nr:isochorismatase family protein [Vibrio fluvialis]EKO5122068.1 isochorismatase family protein [Vibrio fluvialis]MBY7910889.1 isochorismatase family protein [Vibrio fluvialis]MBY7953825.1 isochorismatase family protein [Vibrio fluvialis]MBY8064796.1 isochorismatase family protein [Vibrio fluvialis]MBY8133776.1 isochorismatase family protein [Vibrio fluvialis]